MTLIPVHYYATQHKYLIIPIMLQQIQQITSLHLSEYSFYLSQLAFESDFVLAFESDFASPLASAPLVSALFTSPEQHPPP